VSGARDAPTIALAVAAVLLLTAGGAWLVDRARTGAAPRSAPRSTHPRALVGLPPGARRVTLELSGMYCPKCATRIGIALDVVPGVLSAEIDAKRARAHVVCDGSAADTSLVAAVARAGPGYAATVLRR